MIGIGIDLGLGFLWGFGDQGIGRRFGAAFFSVREFRVLWILKICRWNWIYWGL